MATNELPDAFSRKLWGRSGRELSLIGRLGMPPPICEPICLHFERIQPGKEANLNRLSGGEGGIRTPDTGFASVTA